MPWFWLLLAGILEVVWSLAMKQSQGFTRPLPTVITVVAIVVSLFLLSLAMKSLPLGTAYTVWTGIGAVGAFIVGVVVLGEPLNAARLLAAALVIGGVITFKLSG